jgi:hypothetical protein
MNDCQRADYLILLNGGSVRRLKNISKQAAIVVAYQEAIFHRQAITLVEVIGEVRIEAARWVDAKDQTK